MMSISFLLTLPCTVPSASLRPPHKQPHHQRSGRRLPVTAASANGEASSSAEATTAESGSRAEVLARIARAKQYKQQQADGLAPTPSTPSSAAMPTLIQQGPSSSSGLNATTVATPQASTSTAEQPAYWLQGVLTKETEAEAAGIDKGLRPEEFTQQKESLQRSKGVEIISVDKSYKPKVSTWGMFPRPKNISEAYGGGRTIQPGEQLESEEEARKRDERTKAMLLEYKKSVGLYLEPEVEKQCNDAFAEAEQLFKAGKLKSAFEKYGEVQKLVPAKTKLAGLASLQRAIIMDSFGYNEQAQSQYKSLVMHPAPEVGKRAKRMLFGFDAAKFLKADTMDFSGKKQAWAKYFTQNSRVVYVQTEEERAKDAEASRQAALLAVAVMLGPVVVFGALALSK